MAQLSALPIPAIPRVRLGAWQIELLPPAGYCTQYVASSGILGFAFDPQFGEHALGSDRRQAFQVRANSLAWLPAGCDVYSRSEGGGEYLRIMLDADLGGERCMRDVLDNEASPIGWRLRRALIKGGDCLEVEDLALGLVQRLQTICSNESPSYRSWMTPNRLRKVDELIEERLSGGLLVADLASALNLSVGFFARAFREATGRSPRDHIIARRLARARVLIEANDASLAIIASKCGFASHAHMSNLFRHRLGFVPSDLKVGQASG